MLTPPGGCPHARTARRGRRIVTKMDPTPSTDLCSAATHSLVDTKVRCQIHAAIHLPGQIRTWSTAPFNGYGVAVGDRAGGSCWFAGGVVGPLETWAPSWTLVQACCVGGQRARGYRRGPTTAATMTATATCCDAAGRGER
jgi:hypothetical protein